MSFVVVVVVVDGSPLLLHADAIGVAKRVRVLKSHASKDQKY